MWNDDHYLIWEHTVKISTDKQTNSLKCTTIIPPNYVQLNSFSFMNVKLVETVIA